MALVNYATNYLQALQQKFAAQLSFNALYNSPNNANIRFVNAKTIQIPRLSVGGFVDVDRDTVGEFSRRVDNDWETKTLEHDREFRTLVDPMDIDETNMALSIANITSVFNDEQKIPEMDKYMASKLYAEYTDLGGEPVEADVTADNILAQFDTLMEKMDEAEVPQEGRIMYVTPKVNTALKTAQGRALVAANNGTLNRSIYDIDSVTIEVVPTSRMKTMYNFTDGAVADESAGQITMILIHPSAVISPMKYEFVSLDQPSARTGGKYLYYERKYWDVFLVENKLAGVEILVAPAAPAGE